MSGAGIDCGVVHVTGVDIVDYCGVCERWKCCVDCGVVYVSGVGATVCARLPLLDEEPFAVLLGKKTDPLYKAS